MRILCLHGMGTNSKVCSPWVFVADHSIRIDAHACTGAGDAVVYEYVDGGEPNPPAPGIETLIGPDEGLAYYDQHSAESVLTAIDDLSEYIAEEGPFDGVMGFSQGASMAAMVMVRARHANPPPFQFAIFFCAGLPYCEKALRAGELKFLRAEDTCGPVIHVPTANIFGTKDPDVSYSKALVDLCQPWGRIVLDHGAGHEIPRVPVEVVDDMARAVEKVVTKASIGQ